MEIALIADDKKKELMVEFCTAYCGILSKHRLCATGKTAKYVSEATGLRPEHLLSGGLGGMEQVASRVCYNEIDLLLYFRDTSCAAENPHSAELSRVCDLYNIPIATNIATAEILVMALDRGDLQWRTYEKAKNKK
ncbi:MAG: methylglyoxal synthase [Clostridia bacterium]|nr:methylglyoxal synthase [Clostridia bacterium]MBQ9129991.1 methylglyoxal synthase [Clostridia bacterium]